MSTPIDQFYLRQEARPFAWAELDPEQRDALMQIAGRLHRAVLDLSEPKVPLPPTVPLDLDEKTTTRVVFLSGDRGTGKTSVLLSLIKACTSPCLPPDWPAEFRDWLPVLRGRLAWLAPLDMEPLPGPTNLLASILARIEDCLLRLGGGRQQSTVCEGGQHSEILDLCSRSQQALLALQQLQTDVALAWDGNLDGRGAHLDPDPFAVEVMRAEQVRLRLNDRFHTALDCLAGSKQLWSQADLSDPLFVLPVDDCDLSPTRCTELLRLLRMISVRRLFTIVLGDESTARKIVRLNIKKDLRKLAGDDIGGEMESLANEVAIKAMQKLLPIAQRFYLRHMNVQDVLGHQHPGTDKTIRQLLNQVGDVPKADLLPVLLAGSPDQPGFADFFLPTYNQTDAAEPSLGRHYKELSFLTMTRREAVDFWQMLNSRLRHPESAGNPLQGKRDWEGVVSSLAPKIELAIEEDASIPDGKRGQLLDSTHWRPTGGMRFETEGLEMESHSAGQTRIDLDKQYLSVARCKGWDLHSATAMHDPDAGSPEHSRLTPRASSAIAFLHDILTLGPKELGQSTNRYLPVRRIPGNSHKMIGTYWTAPDGSGTIASIHWFPPEWIAFWEFDVFTSLWN